MTDTIFTCQECGNAVLERDMQLEEPLRGDCVKDQLCFECQYWLQRVQTRDSLSSIRTGGFFYWDVKEPTCQQGHDGRIFRVHRHDGVKITTGNLWFNGRIPERFRARLPDNANIEPT